MNFKLLKDSNNCLPAKPGKYQWWSSYLKTYIPVDWNGENFRTLEGKILSNMTVRYWR